LNYFVLGKRLVLRVEFNADSSHQGMDMAAEPGLADAVSFRAFYWRNRRA